MPRKEPMRPQPGGTRQPVPPYVEIRGPESTEQVVPTMPRDTTQADGAAASGPKLTPKRTGYSRNVPMTDNYMPPKPGKSLRAQQKG